MPLLPILSSFTLLTSSINLHYFLILSQSPDWSVHLQTSFYWNHVISKKQDLKLWKFPLSTTLYSTLNQIPNPCRCCSWSLYNPHCTFFVCLQSPLSYSGSGFFLPSKKLSSVFSPVSATCLLPLEDVFAMDWMFVSCTNSYVKTQCDGIRRRWGLWEVIVVYKQPILWHFVIVAKIDNNIMVSFSYSHYLDFPVRSCWIDRKINEAKQNGITINAFTLSLWLLIYSLYITSWFPLAVVLKDHLRSFSKRVISRSHHQAFRFHCSRLDPKYQYFEGLDEILMAYLGLSNWCFKPSLFSSSQTFCRDCVGQRLYSLQLRWRPPNSNSFHLPLPQKIMITS